MNATFCDNCGNKIADTDERSLRIELRRHFERLHLCGGCSRGVLEMLKHMRGIKELDIIR